MTLHQVLLNGVDRTAYCLGWETEQAATYGTRSARVEFTLDVSPSVNDTLELRGDYNGTLYTVFKGVVTKVTQTLGGKSRLCEALDYTYWLFFRLVFEKAYKDKKAHEIVQDLIGTYVPNVTTSNVSTSFTKLYDKTFDKLTVFEAIRYLAETEDADFWVRWDQDLYFKPRTAASQASVSLEQGVNVLEASYERSDDRLVNWLRFLGGVGYKPSDRDSWTENAGWDKDAETLTYDSSVVKAGVYSVKGTISTDGGAQRFWRPAAKDLGLVLGASYSKLYFWLRANSLAWNTLRIELCKDASNYLYQALTLSAKNTWEQKALDVGSGSAGWTTVGSFSWVTDPINYIQVYHALTAYSLIQETQSTYDTVYAAASTRVGQRYTVGGDTHISRVDFQLAKTGSPAGYGYIRIRKVSDDSTVATIGSIDVATLPTSLTWYQFPCDVTLDAGEYRFTFEYSGGDGSNYVRIAYRAANVCAGMRGYYSGGWYDWSSTDMTIRIIVSPSRNVWLDELYFYTPQISVDREDSTSQTAYRRRDALKSDNTVSDSVWADGWAASQISLYKDPYVRLRVTAPFLPGQVEAGQKITVTLSDFDISGQSFRVLALRHRVPDAVTELELCPVLPLSLEEALARLRRELSDVIRRTA
ncbi:MAG: hypothetical protein QW057_02250 [Candidatus Bathyarchaeia archaeon]